MFKEFEVGFTDGFHLIVEARNYDEAQEMAIEGYWEINQEPVPEVCSNCIRPRSLPLLPY